MEPWRVNRGRVRHRGGELMRAASGHHHTVNLSPASIDERFAGKETVTSVCTRCARVRRTGAALAHRASAVGLVGYWREVRDASHRRHSENAAGHPQVRWRWDGRA